MRKLCMLEPLPTIVTDADIDWNMDESLESDTGQSTSNQVEPAALGSDESENIVAVLNKSEAVGFEDGHCPSAAELTTGDGATGICTDFGATQETSSERRIEAEEERGKLVIDTEVGDVPCQLESRQERNYRDRIYFDSDGTAYVIEGQDCDAVLQQLSSELGSVQHLREDSAVQLVSLLHITAEGHSDAERGSTKSSSPAAMRRYKAYNFRSDDVALLKDIPSFSISAQRILMCLACKLSFGATKPFVNHAVLHHQLVLLKEEEELLAVVSAVLHKCGPGDCLYFLRPDCPFTTARVDADYGQGNTCKPDRTDDNCLTFSKQPVTGEGHAEDDETNSVANLEQTGETGDCASQNHGGSAKDMTPADIARTVMLASELSASRLLQRVSQNVRDYHGWAPNSTPSNTSEGAQIGGFVAVGCGGHGGSANGRSAGGVECPKCDVVLGSSRSLGGHMTMTHSRNSCKTLKCPKCNWHYKYPETLEIHMKEKHPESEVNCVYCITNQAHPRLSRGETYTCGYKPFRCDVCKYSTTTKGNLSIHMQSDKHLNNVQELQQGKLMVQAQATGSVSGLNFGPSMTEQGAPVQLPTEYDVSSGKAAEAAAMAFAQACATNPTPNTAPVAKNKPSWRCDVCNYETNVARNLRIHMTSEKHAHNMGVLQRSVKHLQQTIQGYSVNSSSNVAPVPGHPSFGNLPAFQQSTIPKDQFPHSSSTGSYFPFANQHSVSPLSGDLDAASAFNLQAALLQEAVEDGSVFQCCVCMVFCADNSEDVLNHIQQDRSQPADGDVAAIAGQYYCNLCRYKTHLKANFQLHTKTDKHLQRLQLVNHVREGRRENHWRLKYLNPNNPVQLRCCACNHLANSFHKLQMHTATLRHKCFVRAYRRIHQTDEEWRRMAQATQQKQQQQIFYCSLCDCGARTKNGMLSHLHSNVHGENVNRLGSLMDLSDGCGESDAADWIVVKPAGELENGRMAEQWADKPGSNSDNARMNECSETDRSVLNLAWHNERGCDEDEEFHSGEETVDEGESFLPAMSTDPAHCCSRCSSVYETEAELCEHYANDHGIVKPARTTVEEDRFFDAVRTRSGPETTNQNSVEDELVNYAAHNSAKERLSSAAGSHSTVRCPLCQQECGPETNEMEAHLIQVHNSSTEGARSLIPLFQPTSQLSSRGPSVASDASPSDANHRPASPASSSNSDKSGNLSGNQSTFSCPSCSVPFKNLDELYGHQAEVGHIEMKHTPQGIGYLCWWKGCNQYFKTLPAIQAHFREIHAKRPQAVGVTSDRHLYRYRCNQCSQAYKTEEKLHQHQIYHQMRAATTCVLCSRSFRTVEALKKHVESTHGGSALSAEEIISGSISIQPSAKAEEEENDSGEEEFADSPLNATAGEPIDEPASCNKEDQPPLIIDETPDSVEEYMNTPAMAEAGYADSNRKFRCHRCKVAFTRQSYLSVHNRTVAHRRGDRVSFNMEKYLDPSRPYKCDVCMESFTQKNILLVHKNSVMHISKMKKAMDNYPNGNMHDVAKGTSAHNLTNSSSSSTAMAHRQSPLSRAQLESKSNSTNSNKRYKCNACDTYVTESTIEIHLRSVKHQSRASKMPHGGIHVVPDAEDGSHSRTAPSAKDVLKRHFQRSGQTNNKTDPQTSVSASSASAFPAQDVAAAYSAFLAGLAPYFAASYHGLPSAGTSASAANTHECAQCKKSFATQAQLHSHKEKCCKTVSVSSSTTAIEQALCNSNRFVRSCRGNPFKRLLEDYGFEVVMQFNEMQPQKRAKSAPAEGCVSTAVSGKEADANVKEHHENQAALNAAVPEVKKCVCSECGATFSSVWVFKAHFEHVHGIIVPLDCVEETSEEFKQAYEKKYSLNGCGTNQQEASPNRPIAAPTETRNTEAMNKAQQGFNQQQIAANNEDTQLQQQQQLLALNAIMQQLNAAAQMPSMTSNSALAAAIGMSQFPFMSLPFGSFGVPNPFLPMMMPPGLDQLAFVSSAASSSIISTAAPTALTVIASNAASVASFVQPSTAVGIPSMITSSAAQAQQQHPKRARTRITDDQLKVLREYFDINNSPTEEQIEEMSRKSGLALKVIKHWFRNTLFKERQRCKDSPYNFSIPPSYSIDLEEYEKTGEAKITTLNANGEPITASTSATSNKEPEEQKCSETKTAAVEKTVKIEVETVETRNEDLETSESDAFVQANGGALDKANYEPQSYQQQSNPVSPKLEPMDQSTVKAGPDNASLGTATEETLRQLRVIGALSAQFPPASSSLPFLPTAHVGAGATAGQSQMSTTPSDTIANLIATAMSPGQASIRSGSSRRANRTRFTECQIKTLQEFFEKNAYPKDDDLEYLSQKLSLSPRVVVVWFQNARQKARKIYENQPSESDERFQRTPGLNYQCKGCKLVFQRYYELIKHQKIECYKDEGSSDMSASPTPTSSASTTPKAPCSQYQRSASPVSGDVGKGENEYKCVQCNAIFSSATHFGEHIKAHSEDRGGLVAQNSLKRAFGDIGDSGSENVYSGDGVDALSDDQDSNSSKRQRTQILPEQLDTLYKKYTKDANPSSRNLEKIAQETGLNKRVVQVWFQNTRARERRGQLNDRQFFNKRCPFCGILHHSKQTMEAHLHSRHAAQLGKTEVNIDSLPDAEEVPTITTVPVPETLLNAARSGASGNELAQSMLSFGMVPGTTTVAALGRTTKVTAAGATSAASGASLSPLDLSRTYRNQSWEASNRPSSTEKVASMGGDYECGRSGAQRSPSNGNSNEEAMSMDDYDDSRSICDQDSPSPHQQVLAALARPQKRFRTHLTLQQVKVMKHLFRDYKTPTMAECETLGQEIGLHKRVVQVWFQNARAKERKAKLSSGDPTRLSTSPVCAEAACRASPVSTRCDLCSVAYTSRTTLQDHLFCKSHLEKVKAVVESEEDRLRIASPKSTVENRMTASDDLSRPSTSKSTPTLPTPHPHQARSQHKQQQSPQKRQQQPLQPSLPSSSASAMAESFLPYMYAGGLPQAYYASLASSMMYSSAFPGMAGMYDLNIHGTPVTMLQIPPAVMKLITSAMGRPRELSCRFTQDGLSISDLTRTLNIRDRTCLVATDLEVGWACRQCSNVFQTEALFSNHQRIVCQSKDPAFKLIQTHYECRVCSERFGTQDGFKAHCQSLEHASKANE